MKARMLALVFNLILFQGCSTVNTMNGIMQSWEGSTLKDVQQQWGPPHESHLDADGNKTYVWHRYVSAYIPQTTHTTTNFYGNTAYSTSTSTGGYQMNGTCDRVLTTSNDGVVKSWNWYGNNCCFMAVAGHCARLSKPVSRLQRELNTEAKEANNGE